MVFENPSVLAAMQAVLVVTVGIGATGALLAWRERPEPGALPLAFLLAGQCWWSASSFFQLRATTLAEKAFWFDVAWLGVGVIPVAWLFFSLSYTGYSQYVRPRYVLAASVVPALTVVFAATNDVHGLVYASTTLVEHDGFAILEQRPGLWFWVAAAYTYLLGVLGVIPLLGFVTSSLDVFRGQSLALLLALAAPWGTNLLQLLGVFPIDITPVAFSVSGVLLLGAITQFRLLGTSPAPIRPARQSLFERMQEGSIVLDRNGHVVEMNEQAAAVFGVDPSDTLGLHFERLSPELAGRLESTPGSAQTVFEVDGQRAYDVSMNRLEDVHGRPTGWIIIFYDITDYLRQQQRLEVLNRAFRHNIRTNTQVIVANADYLAVESDEEVAHTVKTQALEIERISDKIRAIINVFERGREQPTPVRLDLILDECIESPQHDHDVTVHYDPPAETHYVHTVFNDVFSNLVSNAVQHNTNDDPTVWVETTRNDDHVEVTVADNGPGIDEGELALLEQGTETPLEHGSGFGLALAIWATEVADGRITFEENEPTGLVVSVTVPLLSSADDPAATGSSLESDPDGHQQHQHR